MNNVDRAVDLFTSGLTCSQAILAIFGEPYGLDLEMATRLGRPLGGGIGRMAKTCGAVMGSVLTLGLAKQPQDEGQTRKALYADVQEFFRNFVALHGTTDCKGLLGADIGTEEGMKIVQDKMLFSKLCPVFVRDAASILEKLLKYRD